MSNQLPEYTLDEIATHNTEKSLWLIVNDYIYDVTEFINHHPGGAKPFLNGAGKDVTTYFNNVKKHGKSETLPDFMKTLCVGKVKPS
ncbi:cytochrome b5-like protein [Fadolivirus algeromassiliense]|jgi:cytochrome b involved in lipid metabolism|uniref:Cytochrome b5-like protein n=1 Tax=Fadolivirus FV1/VV64 TaxID=3070911 RepID=A0A7D3UUY6_9VIRU|nr:cytochrome b5-like protein [Fadolivirus algeromassiliense]QKF93574.1 cytochrome b5-like protein [Fadolivirus FV1/VV64]